MEDLFDILHQTANDIDQNADELTISDDFDEISHYVRLYQADWRHILHQYHVIDPDDLDHYIYDATKYDDAFESHDSRWYTNDTYQPLDLNRADDIVQQCLNAWSIKD